MVYNLSVPGTRVRNAAPERVSIPTPQCSFTNARCKSAKIVRAFLGAAKTHMTSLVLAFQPSKLQNLNLNTKPKCVLQAPQNAFSAFKTLSSAYKA